MKYEIIDSPEFKMLKSPGYSFIFKKSSGFFMRWGATRKDDPDFGLPEILDIEVSTICKRGCPHCYKSNDAAGKNMSLETFKTVLSNLPKSICQIAFGSGAEAIENPEIFKMMEHCRETGIVPNITVADISADTADRFSKLCGAVAVSHYAADQCYNTVNMLTNRGMDQINIHHVVHSKNYEATLDLINDAKSDPRLEKLNAIVFLGLKKKGRGEVFEIMPMDKFDVVVRHAMNQGISFGFDSCSAQKFLTVVKDHPYFEHFKTNSEPCESLCFSIYIDVDAILYPCSFTCGTRGWFDGINMLRVNDFMKDVWYNAQVMSTREQIINCRKTGKSCFYYDV